MARPLPVLGINVHPGVEDPKDAFDRARIADISRLDLITIQDHPYIPYFLDTWTLLSALAGVTTRVHIGTNVSPLPLRPPAMLAKAAASLDVLSRGRVELGIGAGAFPKGIAAFGGQVLPVGERVAAFEEGLQVIRGLWESSGRFNFDGRYYQLHDTNFGPKPDHSIRIWVGAAKPRMLGIAGRLAGGVLLSNTWVSEDRLAGINRLIDESARSAGRSPDSIRRGYNLMGAIDLPDLPNTSSEIGPNTVVMPPAGWTDFIVRLYLERGMDTFIFWPLGDNQIPQIEAFAGQVAPAVLAELEIPPGLAI
ncbi:LLM class flavin-dependent oxidoreductase [Nitrolancea hollandica]|uniref:Luciferase-like monooxygenase n=1 Tax=Nitrolancea hollandica Lb TaxID=1129897 RepID=I4EDP7_9BACT|nr:LLM class flavin-dependent oxidoreductase [Nitrolancea hollandica]CCF82809.1 Luciferase-like monooxygenase [Nitrolancea hollandica Lb]